MATLTGKSIKNTYTSLLKLEGDTQTPAAGATGIQIKTGDDNATPIYITSDRVGLGDSTPGYQLSIKGAADVHTVLSISSGASAKDAKVYFEENEITKWQVGYNTGSNRFDVYNDSTDKTPFMIADGANADNVLYIDTNKVSINTTTQNGILTVKTPGSPSFAYTNFSGAAIVIDNGAQGISKDTYGGGIYFTENGQQGQVGAIISTVNPTTDSDRCALDFHVHPGTGDDDVNHVMRMKENSVGINYKGDGDGGIGASLWICPADATTSGQEPQGDADDLVLDTSGTSVGMSFLCAADGEAQISFGHSGTPDIGNITYHHTGDIFKIKQAGSTALQIDGTQSSTFAGGLVINGNVVNALYGASNSSEFIGVNNGNIAMALKGNQDTDRFGVYISSNNDGVVDTEAFSVCNDQTFGFNLDGDDPSGTVHIRNSAAGDQYLPALILENTTDDIDNAGGELRFQRRDGTDGEYIADGKSLGEIQWDAYDYNDTSYFSAASIRCVSDATYSTTSNPGRLEFRTTAVAAQSPTLHMTLDSAGKLGIGTETPLAKLSIDHAIVPTLNTDTHAGEGIFIGSGGSAGSGNIQAVLGLGKADSSPNRTGSAIASVQTTSDADQVGIGFYTSPTSASTQTMAQQVLITHEGNVGIGTADPSYELDIKDSGNTFLRLESTSATGEAGTLYKNADQTWTVGLAADSSDSFAINAGVGFGTPDFTVLSSGNVGIGDATPAVKLDIAGTMRTADGYRHIFGGFTGASDHGPYISYDNGADTFNIVTGYNTAGGDYASEGLRFGVANGSTWSAKVSMLHDGKFVIASSNLSTAPNHLNVFDASGGDVMLGRNDNTILSTNSIGSIHFKATEDDGANWKEYSKIDVTATENMVPGSNHGSRINFHTTNNGTDDLELKMVLNHNGRLALGENINTSPGAYIHIKDNDSDADIRLEQDSDYCTLGQSGEFNIKHYKNSGTAIIDIEPHAVNGTSNQYVRFGYGAATTGSNIFRLLDNNGSNETDGQQAELCSSNRASYVCRQGGNFGIGTNNPTAKLKVVGDSVFTGSVYMVRTIYVDGERTVTGDGGPNTPYRRIDEVFEEIQHSPSERFDVRIRMKQNSDGAGGAASSGVSDGNGDQLVYVVGQKEVDATKYASRNVYAGWVTVTGYHATRDSANAYTWTKATDNFGDGDGWDKFETRVHGPIIRFYDAGATNTSSGTYKIQIYGASLKFAGVKIEVPDNDTAPGDGWVHNGYCIYIGEGSGSLSFSHCHITLGENLDLVRMSSNSASPVVNLYTRKEKEWYIHSTGQYNTGWVAGDDVSQGIARSAKSIAEKTHTTTHDNLLVAARFFETSGYPCGFQASSSHGVAAWFNEAGDDCFRDLIGLGDAPYYHVVTKQGVVPTNVEAASNEEVPDLVYSNQRANWTLQGDKAVEPLFSTVAYTRVDGENSGG